jgi:hypothetical protein
MSRLLFLCRCGAAVLSLLCIALSGTLTAQNSPGPQPAPLPPPIVAPVDKPYPGTISLLVDVSNVSDRVQNVHETIPVAVPIKSHEITLLYPEWLPGTHSPSNPLSELAGLVITEGGKRIPWVRDRVNMYAFHVDVPPDATVLDVTFQYLAPLDPKRGRVSSKFADITWNTVVLYPAGYFSRDIKFEPAIRLPEGWKFASAL